MDRGPRQFELPPNMPSLESPGDHPDLLITEPIDVGVIVVNSGKGTNAVGLGPSCRACIQHPVEIGFIQNRSRRSNRCSRGWQLPCMKAVTSERA